MDFDNTSSHSPLHSYPEIKVPNMKDIKTIIKQLHQNQPPGPPSDQLWYDVGSSDQAPESEPKLPRQYPLHPRFLEQDCDFLVKLPREIRQTIYEHALGGQRIHLVPGPNEGRKLSGEKCQEQDKPICLQNHGNCTQWCARKKLNLGLTMGLLFTCRQMYVHTYTHPYTLPN